MINPNAQAGRILARMQKEPERLWKVSDFSSPGHWWRKNESFVGYEAGTRFGDLCRKALVEPIDSPDRFARYRITEAGKKHLMKPSPLICGEIESLFFGL